MKVREFQYFLLVGFTVSNKTSFSMVTRNRGTRTSCKDKKGREKYMFMYMSLDMPFHVYAPLLNHPQTINTCQCGL
jgi:hypothetical protein